MRGVLVAVAVVVVLLLGLGAYGLTRLGDEGNDGAGDSTSDSGSTDSADSGSTDSADSGSNDTGGSDSNAQPSADAVHPDTDWTSSATEYAGNIDKSIAYNCPPNGTISTVWGSEPYTSDSSVCTAAVHEGQISLEDGGWVVIFMRPGENSYAGTNSNGVESLSYDDYDSSFVFG
jgi:hypothetical protein